MPDFTAKAIAGGAPISRDARYQQRIIDAMNAEMAGRGWGPPAPQQIGTDPVNILIQNNDASVIPYLGVASLQGQSPVISPAHNLTSALQAVTMTGIVPTAAGQPFVIMLEPILPAADEEEDSQGGIGQAMVCGMTWVQVNINTGGDGFAQTKSGDATQLDSTSTSTANCVPILWQPGSTGTQWCLVLLGAQAGSGGGGTSPVFEVDGTSFPVEPNVNYASGLNMSLFGQDFPLVPQTKITIATLPFQGARVRGSGIHTLSAGPVPLAGTGYILGYDTGGYWSAGAPSQVTTPTAGYYAAGFYVTFNNSCWLTLNGGGGPILVAQPSGSFTSGHTIFKASAGAAVELNIGSPITTAAGDTWEVWIARLSM